MSYRTFKKLLGENSLERKCRFLFGGALMLLITGSFYFYARLTLRIVKDQHLLRAKLLLAQNLQMKHWEATQRLGDGEVNLEIRELSREFKPTDLRENRWKFIPENYESPEATVRPSDQAEFDAFEELVSQGKSFVVQEDDKQELFHYYEKILATESCIQCHRDYKYMPRVQNVGDVMGVAKLSWELVDTRHDVAQNNAILIAMAFVTTFLAMLAAYVIVRYVIVKPVIHLKDVSDAIAHGDLDQRADIRTGDEFQELSHAFNRMLRHLVNTQEELQEANATLDHKVDELAQANLSLHEMNKIKSEFLATMSHELRTPLNSILGFSDILTEADNLNDKQRKFVLNIQRSGNNLLSLINDILDLAKIESGRMELHVDNFSVQDIIERIVSQMRPLSEKKNIDLQFEIDAQLSTIQQDSGKLQQILYNLLSNAVKFTPSGGRIHVAAYPVDRQMFDIVVSDTGIGIPLEDQERVFEKFRQGSPPLGDDALKREYEGTGLGLSIVKELCKLLGGEILLDSEFGKGSTFTVRLPLKIDDEAQAA